MNRQQRRANKTNNTSKLVRMSAFYKSDTADGISLCLTPDDTDLDKFSKNIEELLVAMDDKNGEFPMTPEFAFGQLQEVIDEAHAATSLSFREQLSLCVIVYGNVQWLEKHGHLKPDEYNGMQYLRMRAAK